MARKERNAAASLKLVAADGDEQQQIEHKLCGTLTAIYQRLTDDREKQLQAGMLVQWKPGLKNKKTPEYGKPAIVVEVLNPPILNPDNEAYTTYFREPLGIVVGLLDDDGDFLLFHVDARRFEPYTGAGGEENHGE